MTRPAPRRLAAISGAALLVGLGIAFGCSTFSADTPPVTATDGGDAGAPDAAIPSVCDHVDASFCDDFEVLPLGAKWPMGADLEGGTLTLVDGSVASPLYALQASLLDNGLPSLPGTKGFAQLFRYQSRNVALPVVVVDADLKIDGLGGSKDGVVGLVSMGFDDNQSVLLVVGEQNGMVEGSVVTFGSAADAGPSNVFVTLSALHTWFHVSIVIDLANAKLDFFVDGEQRVNGGVGIRNSGPQYLFGVGAFATQPTGTNTVTIDNVVITAR